MPDPLPWSPRGYDPNTIRHSWTGNREEVVGAYRRLIYGLSDQEIFQDPEQAGRLHGQLVKRLSEPERQALKQEELWFIRRLAHILGLRYSRGERLAAEAEADKGIFGSLAEGAGAVLGGVSAAPLGLAWLADQLIPGEDVVRPFVGEMVYKDPTLSASQAARRTRDLFRGAFDPRYLEMGLEGQRDSSELLASAIQKAQERERLGLPVQLEGELLDREVAVGSRGEAFVPSTGVGHVGEVAGDIGALILGTKGLGVAGGLASRAPVARGVSQLFARPAQALSRGPLGRTAMGATATGAAFGAVGAGREESWSAFPREFLFGAGMHTAGQAIAGLGGGLRARGLAGQRTLGLSPGVSKQVGTGMQQLSGRALAPVHRGGRGAAAIRAAARGGAETAKLTAGSTAANVYEAMTDEDLTLGEAFTRVLEEIPAHAVFGAIAAARGRAGALRPESGGKVRPAEERRQLTEEPVPRAMPRRKPFESLAAYSRRAREATPTVRQTRPMERAGRGGAMVEGETVFRVEPGKLRQRRREAPPRPRQERMDWQLERIQQRERAAAAVAGERGREFRQQLEARVEFDRRARAREIAAQRRWSGPEAMAEAMREQIREVARRAESLLPPAERVLRRTARIAGRTAAAEAEISRMRADFAQMMGNLRSQLRRSTGAHTGHLTRLWNRTLQQIRSIDPTLAIRAQAQMVRAQERKKPVTWEEFMPPTEPVYEGMERKPAVAELLPEPRPTRGAEVELPHKGISPDVEPVPGEIQRQGLELAYPEIRGRRVRTKEAGSAVEAHARFVEQFRGEAPEIVGDALFRARAQGEGLPREANRIKGEETFWRKVTERADVEAGSYEQSLKRFRKAARERYGKQANQAIAQSEATGAARKHLKEYLQESAHGADIGIDHAITRQRTIDAIAHPKGQLRSEATADRRWKAAEMVREAELRMGFHEEPFWSRIAFTIDERMRKLDVHEQGLHMPSERLYEAMVKGIEPRHQAGEFPWRTIFNEQLREGMEERYRSEELPGERTVKAGAAGEPVPLEHRLPMQALTGYYLGGGIKGLAERHGVGGDLYRFQEAMAKSFVEVGLAEKVGEFHYRWTPLGERMVHDLDNWLRANKRYHQVSPDFKPPWTDSPHRPWDIRCLSPCGEQDGKRRLVAATGKHGLLEGEIDKVPDHEPAWHEKLMEWGRSSWKRIRRATATSPADISFYHLTKKLDLRDQRVGEIRSLVREQFTPLWDVAPRIVQIGEREGTRWRMRRAQLESLIRDGLGKEWFEDKSFLEGKTRPEMERVIDTVEQYGKLTAEGRAKRREELGAENWEKVQAMRAALQGVREDIVFHLTDPIRQAIRSSKANGRPVDESTGIDLHAILPTLATPHDPARGMDLKWSHELHREIFKPENREVLQQVIQAKTLLDPGASTEVRMGNVLLRVQGYGVKDYFPHNWIRYDHSTFVDQQFKSDATDTTPVTHEGIKTTQGAVRMAHGYARSSLVPQAKRKRFVSNWLRREAGAEGYIKHPAVVLMYIRESYRKIQHERVMRLGENEALGEYTPLDMRSPVQANEMLYRANVAGVEHSHSSMAGHSVGANLMLEVRGVLPKRYGDRLKATGPLKFFLVKRESPLGMREKGAEQWTPEDRLVLLSPGMENLRANYITLKGKEIQRARIYVRDGGFIQGLTGPVENTMIWDRLEEIARGGAPKRWKARRGLVWRIWESIEMTLGSLGHHAALGGVVNPPAAQMNLIEGNLVLNAATNGFHSIGQGWRTMRGMLPAVGKRIPMYWKLAAEGKSHKETWDAIAEDILKSDPNNVWAQNYKRILSTSPYDLGGMHEKNMWSVDVVENLGKREEGPITQAMVEARDRFGAWLAKHMDPKLFTSFEISEQHTRQMLYMTRYDDMLKRYGEGAGKGNAPYVNPETGEYFRVVPGEGMRREGTPERPHLMSAHDLAFDAVMRTHFIYRLAYHPGIMRWRPWRLLGHLGSFGMLQAMERARDVKALFTVPTGFKFREPDLAHFSRGVRHIVASWALYTVMDEIFGMDVGNFIGAHPTDLPLVSEIPQAYAIPNAVRFIPGGIPAGISTMPAKMLRGAGGGIFGAALETGQTGDPGAAINNQVRMFKESNRTFWLPFDNAWNIPGGFLTIPFSRSIVGRTAQILEAESVPHDPEKPLRFGPASRPVSTSYGEMLARVFFPGSPSSWSEGYRTSRYREGGRLTRQYIRDDLVQRFFRADTVAERTEIWSEAENLGIGDFARILKSRVRLRGWSPRVRAYAISDPLLVKLQNALEDVDRLSPLERAKVHELIWGKGTPRMSIRPSKLRPYLKVPGAAALVKRYIEEFALKEP